MILAAESLNLFWIGPGILEQFPCFSKEFFESRRRNNFYESGGLVRRIPESMGDASRFQNIIARVREKYLVTDPCSELAFYHVGIFVSIMVKVRRDKSSRLHRAFDY